MNEETFVCECCGQTFSQHKKYSAIVKTEEILLNLPQTKTEVVHQIDGLALALYCEECCENYLDVATLIWFSQKITSIMRKLMRDEKAIKPIKVLMNKNFYLN